MLNLKIFWSHLISYKLGVFSVSSILTLISIIAAVFLSARFSKKATLFLFSKNPNLDEATRESIATIISYFLATCLFFILFQSVGYNLDSLKFIGGGLGIGIGFGLQSTVREFSSGLIILMNRQIKVNDFIQFGSRQFFMNQQGTVTKIALLYTTIKTKDGGNIIIPNSQLLSQPILNWSYDDKPNRIKLPLKVKPDTDLLVFTEIVMTVANLEPLVFKEPPPKLVFKNLFNAHFEFELHVWIDSIKNQGAVINSLNFNLEYYLTKRGIEINFPSQEFILYRKPSPELQPAATDDVRELSTKDLLRQVPYFKDFDDLEIRKLIEAGYRQNFNNPEYLFHEGDSGNSFYIILSGRVEVLAEKLEKRLAVLNPGSFFGELSLMLGIPRTASIRVLEPSVFFVLHNRGFKHLLQSEKQLRDRIIQELGKHQQELANRQQELREKGLIPDTEDDSSPVVWMRNRLKNLFG